MKLIECYIENFGKISKEKFTFKDGLNCFKNDNGSGKTTLAAFIKVMLYGMSESKKANLDENERKHYLPWQGGVCGGSLTFSSGGKTYRVERSFGSRASDDSYTLYDTATGKISGDFPDGLGEGLFGIDADGFERTVFLSERSLTPKSTNKSISAKLSDLVGCDGDIGGMDDALDLLEEKRKFYYKKGGSGEIANTRAKIDELTRKLDSLVEVEKAAAQYYDKMRDISKKITEARADAKNILKEREAATVRAAETNHEKKYKELVLSIEESQKKRSAVSEIFGVNIPSFTDIDEAAYKSVEAKNLMESATDTPEIREFKTLSAKFDGRVERAKIEEAKDALAAISKCKKQENDPRLNKAKRIFAKRVPTDDELYDIEKLLSDKKKKTPIGCIIAYIIFAICCVAGIFIEQTIIAIGVVGILAVLITEIILKGQANSKRKKAIIDFFQSVCGVNVESDDEAKARLNDMRELLPVIKNAFDVTNSEELMNTLSSLVRLFPEMHGGNTVSDAERIVKEYTRYAELAVAERYMSGDRTARYERAKKLKAEANEFVSRYKTRTSDPFGELRYALTEYERLTAELVAKRDELARLENLNSIGEGGHKKAVADIEMLDRKRQENENLIAELSREHTITERLYNSSIDELEGREEILMRRGELEELIAKQADNFDTIQLTKQYLTLAKDNMTARYLGKTKAGFVKYAEKISGITGESFEMDTDFGITKQEGATTRDVSSYSRGTRDLYNLAARLGLVDSLYEKEKPFILLDDPFAAFDDKKTAAALKMLSEIAKEKQVIYFTCSKARSV